MSTTFLLKLLFLLLYFLPTFLAEILCGPCKITTHMAREALDKPWISNYLLTHCSSLVPFEACRQGVEVAERLLQHSSDTEFCAMLRLCYRKIEKHQLKNKVQFEDDTLNILFSRINSVENFTEWSANARPKIRHFVMDLPRKLPLFENLALKPKQESAILNFLNRFLMAVDYRMRSERGEGLREHVEKACDII